MGSSWGGSMFILVVILVGVLEVPMARGDMSPSQCKEEQRLIVNACKPVIFGLSPSAACCQRVRVMHAECVCPAVTPKLAALIGVQRTIKQIEGCGRTVPHNFKCGSITTP
ncbi:hypothetical protein CCACVL1_05816 [Corchorus capsularis]|uniref:Bifunctional inhibitor/plant lipid transfer protein/seed storage helical domain-containing protein n=1 Tax=Corchorus capsularis TaxID=210143 RepID=A0A1R3JIV3_COCAP|nr:hypothetical protein CCACVL1_05816 [Corchorus capsularis]